MKLGERLAAGARCDRSGPLWTSFLKFHGDNPWVYSRLREIADQLWARGFRHYSTRTIIGVLRFEWDLKTGGEPVTISGGETISVKLNDHHTTYYARMMIEEHPGFALFFELRAAEGDPGDPDEEHGPEGDPEPQYEPEYAPEEDPGPPPPEDEDPFAWLPGPGEAITKNPKEEGRV